jgi:hypothetical protein
MNSGRGGVGNEGLDFEAVFEAVPSPLLVLDRDFVIRAATGRI